jgi:hypothetical protein
MKQIVISMKQTRDLIKIRAALGLSQAHSSGPLSANHAGQILAFEGIRSMGEDRVDCTLGKTLDRLIY